jgi:hypothetical protein
MELRFLLVKVRLPLVEVRLMLATAAFRLIISLPWGHFRIT